MIKKKKNERQRMGLAKSVIQFPTNLLQPVAKFLQDRLNQLTARRQEVENDDPFNDTSRLEDNASPDSDAAEQFGHARSSAIREQLDRRIIQTRKALTRLKIGKYGICEDCGQMIDTDRLMVYPDATLCARDATKREK